MLNINTSDSMIVFGMQFLNSFYQVFDLQRKQMALVPNIYSKMPSTVLIRRNMSSILLPSFFATISLFIFYMLQRRNLRKESSSENTVFLLNGTLGSSSGYSNEEEAERYVTPPDLVEPFFSKETLIINSVQKEETAKLLDNFD